MDRWSSGLTAGVAGLLDLALALQHQVVERHSVVTHTLDVEVLPCREEGMKEENTPTTFSP